MGWSSSRRGNPKERRLLSLAVACVFLYAGHSHAQLYKWTDENGKVHYTDSIPPSANDRARKELRADGTVRRETARALTAEEKRAAALKAEEEARARVVQDERDRKDRALLNTYPNLQDFDRMRDRALATMDSDIRSLTDKEAMLNKVIESGGTFVPPAPVAPPPAPTPAPAAAPAAGKAAAPAAPPAPAAAAKAAVAKSASARLIEAKGELPRLTETINRKRKDRADMAGLYASERVRLARLIDAEKAKLAANSAPSTTATVPSPTAPRR